jgi:6,7-dimethyl-8-ribityllumazine synthase
LVDHLANGLKVGIIASRFNEFITKRLYEAALQTLAESGVAEDGITTVWVPGCFEIPLALAEMAEADYDAVVCLGVVIRGETSHFDYVAGEAARGIAEISRICGLPVGFGMITAETTEQAIDRAGGKRGNKGREAALAAVEMAGVIGSLRRAAPPGTDNPASGDSKTEGGAHVCGCRGHKS